jgi:hypothetical protein
MEDEDEQKSESADASEEGEAQIEESQVNSGEADWLNGEEDEKENYQGTSLLTQEASQDQIPS